MDHEPEFCAGCKSAAICFNYGCMDEPKIKALAVPTWTAEEIADACVRAGLGILECNSLLVTLKGSAPGTPEAPAWRAVTGPGQVEVGARLRFTIGDKQFSERAKLILNAGTDKEEVIYDKGRNFYYITAMVLSGFSNHKNVEYLPPKRAAQLDGGQGEGA